MFRVLMVSILLTGAAAAQTASCPVVVEPMIYMPPYGEADDPMYRRSPAVFGAVHAIPSLQVRLLEQDTDKRIDSDDLRVVYRWRWFGPPTAKHPVGGWIVMEDVLACRMEIDGTIVAAAHEVKPRGWFDGKGVRPPEFLGIAIIASTGEGSANVSFNPVELERFRTSQLVVRVQEKGPAKLSWKPKEVAR